MRGRSGLVRRFRMHPFPRFGVALAVVTWAVLTRFARAARRTSVAIVVLARFAELTGFSWLVGVAVIGARSLASLRCAGVIRRIFSAATAAYDITAS
jgi:hypothetical protein